MQMHTVSLKLLQSCCSWQKEVKKNTISSLCCVKCEVESWWTPGRRRPYCAGLGEEICWEAGEMPSFTEPPIFSVYFTPSQKLELSCYLSSPFLCFFLVYSHDCHFLHPPLLSGHALYYFPPSLPHSLPIWAPGDLNLPLTSWCVRSV